MAHLPRLKTDLKLSLASNHTFLKCDLLQSHTENPSPARHFPTAQEVYSAGILAATLADCGGLFAGPDFLFSGNINSEQCISQIARKSHKNGSEISFPALSDSHFFDQLFASQNTMVSRSHNS